ncbi:MAG: hypothetical protein IT582_10265 [Opitutaceae bacterium]|nr:hypothetical protein [Opitutaceae bacterium]
MAKAPVTVAPRPASVEGKRHACGLTPAVWIEANVRNTNIHAIVLM